MPDPIIVDVARLAEAATNARAAWQEAIRQRDDAIRTALAAGYRPSAVAEAADLSREQLKTISHQELTPEDLQRQRTIAALEAWRDAEGRYQTEAAKYVSAGWLADGPLPPPERALTREGLAELNRLRGEARAAQIAYQATLPR
jgi:hypothetical protein